MENSWIKLTRGIQKHWVFDDPNYLKAWITILLNVNFKDGKQLIDGDLIICKRGQSILSLQSWVKLFGKDWTIQKVRTFFKLLQKDNMANIEGLRKTTRLSVCNYEAYQNEQHTANTQLTDSQHTANTQLTTIEERKESKEGKEGKNITEKKQKYGEHKNVLMTESQIKKLLDEWGSQELERMMSIFSNGLAMKSYKYKDHGLAIRAWKKREDEKSVKNTPRLSYSERESKKLQDIVEMIEGQNNRVEYNHTTLSNKRLESPLKDPVEAYLDSL